MKAKIALLAALLFVGRIGAIAAPPAASDHQPADPVYAIRAAKQLRDQWLSSLGGKGRSHDMSVFYGQLEVLKKIQASNTDPQLGIPLAYNIASIERIIVVDAMILGQKTDQVVGQDALKNFETVLANGRDMPEWGIIISDVNYDAGTTALSIDGQYDRAIRYWAVCSAQGHPGCMNNLAFELGKKADPTDDEIKQMIDLHAGVVATGTSVQCAGLFSAVSEAKLIHFTGIGHAGDTDIGLLDKAQMFYRQLKDTNHGSDPCSGARIGIDQYMMRLDEGQRQPDLLKDVERQSAALASRNIAGYLLGALDDAGLAEAIAATDAIGTCQLHFYAAWKAKQDGKIDVAREHYQAMLKLKPDKCTPEPLLLRRYLKLSTPSTLNEDRASLRSHR